MQFLTYKRVVNLAIMSVGESNHACDAKIKTYIYRKHTDEGKDDVVEFDVDIIRTFIKKVNYVKVSEFQYKVSADLENAIQVPLSIANIAIKYLITGVMK